MAYQKHTLGKISKRISFFAVMLALFLYALTAGTGKLFAQVVVYLPWTDGPRTTWITTQAKAAGIDIKLLSLVGGELFDRIIAEKNNPQGDVVLGLGDAPMAALKKEGAFQAYVPSWAKGLPDNFKDKDNVIFKFWQTPIVLAYNADRISASEAPKSWLDLTQDKYKKKYVIGSLKWQTTRTILAGILVRFLDTKGNVTKEGWDFIEKLYANAIVVNDENLKIQAFKSGEAVIDFNWFGGAFNIAKAAGYKTVLIDTVGGTPFTSEGIAIMKKTKKLKEAQKFVDWFGSPDVMATYSKQFGQIPAHPEALAKSPAKVQADAKLVKPQSIDWDLVAEKIDGWLQRIELEIR